MVTIRVMRLMTAATRAAAEHIHVPLNEGPRTCEGRVRGYNALDGGPVSLSPERAHKFRALSILAYGGRIHRKWLKLSYVERWKNRCTCPACTKKPKP